MVWLLVCSGFWSFGKGKRSIVRSIQAGEGRKRFAKRKGGMRACLKSSHGVSQIRHTRGEGTAWLDADSNSSEEINSPSMPTEKKENLGLRGKKKNAVLARKR